MKAHSLDILLVAAIVVAGSSAAFAQQPLPTLPRGDAWGAIGWQHSSHKDEDGYRTRGGRRVVAGAGGGVYWSPHLKLEVDTGTPTRGVFSRSDHTSVGTVQTFRYVRTREDRWRIAAAQTYEFLPNAWFSPYLGLGIQVTRQRREQYLDGVVVYDLTNRPVSGSEAGTEEIASEHRTVVRPLATLGFKGYMSRRAFFRSDMRLAFQSGVNEVLVRFGFGLDF